MFSVYFITEFCSRSLPYSPAVNRFSVFISLLGFVPAKARSLRNPNLSNVLSLRFGVGQITTFSASSSAKSETKKTHYCNIRFSRGTEQTIYAKDCHGFNDET